MAMATEAQKKAAVRDSITAAGVMIMRAVHDQPLTTKDSGPADLEHMSLLVKSMAQLSAHLVRVQSNSGKRLPVDFILSALIDYSMRQLDEKDKS
jgi:hypothetical protein